MNFFILIVGILGLIFIWLLWLRHDLVAKLRTVNHLQKILRTDLFIRRERCARLLEHAEKNDLSRRLLKERAELHKAHPIQKEWDFEQTLYRFLEENPSKKLNYLEAKKDIADISATIETNKTQLEGAVSTYNSRRKEFPYTLASAIFGLQKVEL